MIGFLILAHNDTTQTLKLIRRLRAIDALILVHFDKKSNGYSELLQETDCLRFHLIEPRVNVYWGGFSLVEATLLLMEKAVGLGATRLCILSEACWPTVTNNQIYETLMKDCDYININQVPIDSSSSFATRFTRYWPMDCEYGNPKTCSLHFESVYFNEFVNSLPPRPLPHNFALHTGSNWMSLRTSTYKLFRDFTSVHPDITQFFRYTRIPDESFFQTIICELIKGKSLDPGTILPNLHYVDFSNKGRVGGLPKILDESDYLDIIHSGKIFARKMIAGTSDQLCSTLESA